MAVNGFCPKCGAVIHDGKCASCGYSTGKFSGNMSSETVPASQMKKSGSKAAVVSVLIVIIIFIILMSMGIFMIISQVKDAFGDLTGMVSVLPESDFEYDWNWDDGWNEDDWDEDYTYEEYVPSPSDDFYEEFVSTTVRGLSYDIAWNNTYIYTDDDQSYAHFSYEYPMVIGTEKPFAANINAAIYEQAMSFEPVAIENENWGYLDCYVTYMSEELLSVLFSYCSNTDRSSDYRIAALNFDMTTGEMIPMEVMLPTYDFVITFRSNCEKQNGYSYSYELQEMTDEEIMNAITNPETGVAFYTPVGLELGFNYPDGWITVTMKTGTY